LMPCVFPVLSLKAVALAQTGRPSAERQADGLAYLAGVLVSFAILALALLGLRQAGQSLGWGFQFQSPFFVLIMAGLFFVLGLTLSGIVSFGENLTGAGDKLARQAGPAGAFFTGALATIAATPCTAPFMGAALGYALGASAFAGFLVLMAMGLGFAAPVVALSISPALQRLMPRPGRWMETFKQAMAFPLYASAAWMVWVLSLQAGSEGVLAAMVLLVGLGFLAWLWMRMPTDGRTRYAAPMLLAGAVLTGAAAGLIDTSSEAKSGQTNAGAATHQTDVTGLPIIRFSQERIAALQQDGRPVLVNLTAAWCITCKVNEKVALSSERMRTAFNKAGIAYVKGDWTRQDPEITRFLQAFGRAGVPLYLLYPGKPGAPPRVLDQVLTESHVLAELRAIKAER
jgi:thiol:disulfide interchange protein